MIGKLIDLVLYGTGPVVRTMPVGWVVKYVNSYDKIKNSCCLHKYIKIKSTFISILPLSSVESVCSVFLKHFPALVSLKLRSACL